LMMMIIIIIFLKDFLKSQVKIFWVLQDRGPEL
jgi:hypothetical protein